MDYRHRFELRIIVTLLLLVVTGRAIAQHHPIEDTHHRVADHCVGSASLVPGDERWDGRFGFPGIDGVAYAIASHGSLVYIGGEFEYAGTVRANNIVGYDTEREIFFPLGDGVNYHVHTITVADDGDVYIGGEFTIVGGDTSRGLARWDGEQWHTYGSGIDGGTGHFGSCVWAISIVGDDMYVGGDFATIDGTPFAGIARFDPYTASFHPLGDGIDGIVYAIDTMGGDLYVGGSFDRAGAFAANDIARWDGSDWRILGAGADNGIDGGVNAIVSHDGKLYVGGGFERAGSDSLARIAMWDGSKWSAMGDGLSGRYYSWEAVFALAIVDDQLYAGGAFNDQSNFARWTGSSWEPLGQGLIYGLTRVGSWLYAAGRFREPRGSMLDTGRYFARWSIPSRQWERIEQGVEEARLVETVDDRVFVAGKGVFEWNNLSGRWTDLGLDRNASIEALAGGEGKLYVGGDLRSVAGVANTTIASWDLQTRRWASMMNDDEISQVHDMLVVGPYLYIAAWDGGKLKNRLRRLELATGTWVDIDTLLAINSIAADGDDLWVGGSFDTYVGASRIRNVARWRSGGWEGAGEGVPGYVSVLCVDGSRVIAGGDFDTIGFSIVNNIAIYENGTWSGLEGGVRDSADFCFVTALAVDDGTLYVGGEFDRAGTISASNIASFDLTTRRWSPLGSGVYYGGVSELAMTGGALYAVGSFEFAGGKTSYRVGRWQLETSSVGSHQSATGSSALSARPEPFHDRLSIEFEVVRGGIVRLELFDLLGSRSATLLDDMLDAGSYSREFDVGELPPGLYVLRLVTTSGVVSIPVRR